MHYEGYYETLKAWADGLRPDPLLTVWQWADAHRVLSPRAASEPGRWRTSRTPYLKEIMECLSPSSPVSRIVFMAAAQLGKTEVGNNFIGYVIHHAPGPMLAVSPTVELAKRNSKQRIDPLIEESEILRSKIKARRSRDSGNTVLMKEFPGGVLVLTGANSAVGLRSMPARYIFMDEVDAYDANVAGEGDPILLAERRSATFQRRKIFLCSTPLVKGASRIEYEYLDSDQRKYFVPCPHCGGFQTLEFNNLDWENGNPGTVRLICQHCHEAIFNHQKTAMLENGKWRPTAKGKAKTAGFHLNSLYAPVGWFSWEDAVTVFEKAIASKGEGEQMRGFVNTVLGESYQEESEAPDWHRLYERREIYPIGQVPAGGLFLTAGVDVQKDRLEAEIVAWGRNLESWSVDYVVLDGYTARPEVWEKLNVLLNREWEHVSGHKMPIRVMAVDSGAYSQDVYAWVRNHPQASWGPAGSSANQPRTVVAVKGQDRDTALILGASKKGAGGKRRGIRVWTVSNPVTKGELYRWLKLDQPTDEELKQGEKFPPGFCHFPQYGEAFFKQLTAERQIFKTVKGYPRLMWEKEGSQRNEALDCRCYARAAAEIYGISRFNERRWQDFEKTFENHTLKKQQTVKTKSLPSTTPVNPRRARKRSRRIVQSPFMMR
ncbi:phage terminase large subunit family protein [Magnetococcales bacterium HHB-1]